MLSVRKLEVSLLKMYVVNAHQTNRPDKVTEFFEKMTPELHSQPEFREWFSKINFCFDILAEFISVKKVFFFLSYGWH